MRAVVQSQYGGPEVLRVATVAAPTPAADEILVRVHASAVNRTDTAFRSATPALVRLFSGLLRPRYEIPGTEFAGVVEAVGKNVTRFAVGQRVFGRLQDESPGAHAEFVCVGEDDAVAEQPSGVSHAEAAGLCDGVMLAQSYLQKLELSPGDKVLVNGASGSIGTAAVQLAKARGAHVTGVCKTEAIETVESLGADDIIDYEKTDFTACGRRFGVVFDAVGKSSLGKCKRLMQPGAYYLSTELGFAAQNPLLALRTALFGGKYKVLFPFPHYRKREVLLVRELVEAGKYRPVIDRTYPLGDIATAHRYVETGQKVGNVVVEI